MNTYGVDLMGRPRRRRHGAEFKATVIRECMRPGVSIAAVALAHSLNSNMLRKWVIDAERACIPTSPVADSSEEARLPPPSLFPLALQAAPVEGDIRIELHHLSRNVAGHTYETAIWAASLSQARVAKLPGGGFDGVVKADPLQTLARRDPRLRSVPSRNCLRPRLVRVAWARPPKSTRTFPLRVARRPRRGLVRMLLGSADARARLEPG